MIESDNQRFNKAFKEMTPTLTDYKRYRLRLSKLLCSDHYLHF